MKKHENEMKEKFLCWQKKRRKKRIVKKSAKSEKWTSQKWENGPKNSFNSVDHERNRMKSEKFQLDKLQKRLWIKNKYENLREILCK